MPTTLPPKKPAEDEIPENSSNVCLVILGLAILFFSNVFAMQVFVDKAGKIHYGTAVALTWAMMAAMVRGVGFVPKNKLVRFFFSTQACMVALICAFLLRFIKI